MKGLLLVLAGAAIGMAQSAALEGRIVHSLTGEAIGKASVLLSPASAGADWTRSYGTLSDGTGKFVFAVVTPGMYRLRVTRNGFVENPGTELDLRKPEGRRDVEVCLAPHGVIAGRVLDTDGEAMAGAQVQLLRLRYTNGKKQHTTLRTAYADDLGEYRFAGLRTEIVMAGEEMEGVTVTIGEPARMQWRIRGEGDFRGVAVRLLYAGALAGGAVHRTARIEGLLPGHYLPLVDGLPDRYYVQSVLAGEADVTHSGLELAAGGTAELTIVVSAKAGTVEGTAAPGEYKVFAWADVEGSAWLDGEFLKNYEDKGVMVKVEEGGRQPVAIVVIGAAA